uniref:Partner of Y14 and mago-like n=1 Tax=Phallusia mammillata TaxID=59560 RepID=A0A6F9DX87_9ASCI|nr:partner of Y14 and mago-like [Phallusia mammillata]
MSDSNSHLHVSNVTGIVRDDRGVAFIPATQRPDGTWRKAQRVKEGYVPDEDIKRYQTSAARIRSSAPACPGFTAPPPEKPKAVPGLGSSANSKQGPDLPLSKGAKKNLKRKEQRKKKRDEETEVIIQQQYTDLVTGDKSVEEISTKLRGSAIGSSGNQSEGDTTAKKVKNLKKKLRQIDELQTKIDKGEIEKPDKTQVEKIARRPEIEKELAELVAT